MTVALNAGTIGIFGGGQLGRMTAQAAASLGIKTIIFTDTMGSPAADVVAETIVGNYADKTLLQEFADKCDVISFEFENIPAEAAAFVEAQGKLFPGTKVLETCQDRVLEKQFLADAGIPVAPFKAVTTQAELERAIMEIGVPCVLKTARFGYDGKGQVIIHDASEVAAAWTALQTDHAILEAFVEFEREASVIVARNKKGVEACYPIVENIHENHILKTTIAPADVTGDLQDKANQVALKIADAIGLVGLLAVELFLTADGNLVVNELAPRPHNSGHWTMDGAATSQFEQFVRAICNLPLGATDVVTPTRMENLLGDGILNLDDALATPGARLHLYGKADIKPGRKMGHINYLQIT